jgi:hypothetical protein
MRLNNFFTENLNVFCAKTLSWWKTQACFVRKLCRSGKLKRVLHENFVVAKNSSVFCVKTLSWSKTQACFAQKLCFYPYLKQDFNKTINYKEDL